MLKRTGLGMKVFLSCLIRNGHEQTGFSIVELIVVIAILGILMTIGTLNFHQWQVKSNIDRETRELFTDINSARLNAIHTKKRHSIVLNTTNYILKNYSSEGENILAGRVLQTRQVNYQLTKSTTHVANSYYLFDAKGFITETDTGPIESGMFSEIIIVHPTESGAYDCVVLSEGKSDMGKMANGTCSY